MCKSNVVPRKGQPRFMVFDSDNDPRVVKGRYTWDDKDECIKAVRECAYGQFLPWTIVECTKVAGVYLDTCNGRNRSIEV